MFNRAGAYRSQAFAVGEVTGGVIPLTGEATNTGSLNVPRKSNKLYFFRGGMGTPAKWIARSDATGNRPLISGCPGPPSHDLQSR